MIHLEAYIEVSYLVMTLASHLRMNLLTTRLTVEAVPPNAS
jgi:hypothetical protein